MARWYYQVMGEQFGPISEEFLIDCIITGRIGDDYLIKSDEDDSWQTAGSSQWLASRVTETLRARKIRKAEFARQREKEAEENARRLESITISTSSPPLGKYFQIVDTIFAFDSSGKAGFFSNQNADPNEAFLLVKNRLREKAFQLHADAVINCQFEYRISVGQDAVNALMGTGNNFTQVFEIFAYGTAIRFKKSSDANSSKHHA